MADDKKGAGAGEVPDKDKTPKGLVSITVNTTDSDEPKGKITYARVVEIAYKDHALFPNATYSIVYERGPKANPEGTLSKGGAVEIAKGMRFRVKRTGES